MDIHMFHRHRETGLCASTCWVMSGAGEDFKLTFTLNQRRRECGHLADKLLSIPQLGILSR